MKILVADGYNLLYRARTGFYSGENPIVFNFIRSFKALIEQLAPEHIYFVTEGSPKARLKMLPEYKGQRVYTDHDDFKRQRKFCIDMLKEHFPVIVANHQDHECDDVIGAIVNDIHPNELCTIVSTDTDFIQLVDRSQRVSLYNPVKKDFIDPVPYDYVAWKALTGDKSDNIEGFKRVGPKTATKLVTSPGALEKFLDTEEKLTKFNTNVQLIKLEDVEVDKIQFSSCKYNSDAVRQIFETMKFDSLLNDKYWNKFERVFSGRKEFE